jgi:hypothetical protein
MSFVTAPAVNFPILWAASSWTGKLSVNMSYDISAIDQEKANRIVKKMNQQFIKAESM